MQRDFWIKMGSWEKLVCKGTFGLKFGFGGNGCAKGLSGKIGVLGEMSMQRNIQVTDGVWGKWACKKTFGLKIGFC